MLVCNSLLRYRFAQCCDATRNNECLPFHERQRRGIQWTPNGAVYLRFALVQFNRSCNRHKKFCVILSAGFYHRRRHDLFFSTPCDVTRLVVLARNKCQHYYLIRPLLPPWNEPPKIFFAVKLSSGIDRRWRQSQNAQSLTDFVSANLVVVEWVDEPIFRVNNLNGTFDASMVQREDDATADNVDKINVQDILMETKENRRK